MGLGDLVPHTARSDEQPAALLAGEILDTAAGAGDLVRVRLDGDRGQYVGPMSFMPRGAVLPSAGDRALVAFESSSGDPWIVAWREN